MVLLALVVSATRIAGVLVVTIVAANALSFSRYRSKNLRPFCSPIDESADVLADFSVLPPEVETERFFFGLATAPAHVEDNLNDAWLQFAEEQSPAIATHIEQQPVDSSLASASGDSGSQQGSLARDENQKTGALGIKKPLKIAIEAMIRGLEKFSEAEQLNADPEFHPTVASWHNVPRPKERLRFWSDPDIELKLAKDTGISVFRMGIDWARIMPREPRQGISDSVNFAALERYRWIIGKVRSYGMKVMLTLFHHSLPPWAGEYGGWKLEKTVDYFLQFTKIVADRVADLVDYWVTFNEPHIFVILTYCAGVWPGGNPDMIEVATSTLPTGVFKQAMHWIAVAHVKAYDCIHGTEYYTMSLVKPNVGIAHHVSFTRPYGLFDVAAVTLANSLSVFRFVDDICDQLDFIGINYYGQEVISGPGLKLVDDDEYSESGRGIYPDGLFRILLMFHERYKHLNLPFIITENGVSDETDLIRQPYLLEHLLAVYAAVLTGVRVLGYLFWTTSDNWEWADGYGPKFGLVAVDRANNLARIPRPSYYLFKKVVETRQVTKAERMRVWSELQLAAREKRTRPFYRAVDRRGLMYAGGLDEPTQRAYIQRDWRFGHYEMSSLQDPVSRTWRFISRTFSSRRKAQTEEVDDQLLLPDAV
ncbi:beta-glucosidase-like SFR2, chloroplastic isoform X1 [Zingiber officinale]|uniref:beta-glucosidase-like SFR2, chloroplastic isoform X1 n=1 Tax=Zingiber officinale TaxID=94328 RepID=UPI001C4B5F35|nr:beta-glucosidase-like SFR2, chloroplastic isoform X1 [Zingiber officinale]